MKIAYQHLVDHIASNPSIEEVSIKLFQLGHEHEIINDIFEMEFTPNRGDCLSVNGLLRDLAVFYEIDKKNVIDERDLKKFEINFTNHAPHACPHISFLKIDIEGEIDSYHGVLDDYFRVHGVNKNNFFTDISNYISYETGQPTHCYDSEKINGEVILDFFEQEYEFETLLGSKIKLVGKNLSFNQNNKIINLAGIIGGIDTSCSLDTKSVIVECAYFNPEEIIGKSIKYDITSDAAYKFERGVDPLCHESTLRRFIQIVKEHCSIKNVELFSEDYKSYQPVKIPFDVEHINRILGTFIDEIELNNYLLKLGFKTDDKKILAPSYRGDIKNINDIAEEIARVIGYDNIKPEPLNINIPQLNSSSAKLLEANIKEFLVQNGFLEVINNPFIDDETQKSIKVDNPLDSNKTYLRTNLQKSLINNLLYNERRQKDSIKLFEVSNIYYLDNDIKNKRMLGIICSGRVGKNYLDFAKKIDVKFLKDILNQILPEEINSPEIISRDNLETKLKNNIIYLEIPLDDVSYLAPKIKTGFNKTSFQSFNKYIPISEYPSSYRDISFAVKEEEKYQELEKLILNYKNEIVKDIYVFDFFLNEKKHEIKIGFRFIFQSQDKTITEKEVSDVISNIISEAMTIDTVEIPGLAI